MAEKNSKDSKEKEEIIEEEDKIRKKKRKDGKAIKTLENMPSMKKIKTIRSQDTTKKKIPIISLKTHEILKKDTNLNFEVPRFEKKHMNAKIPVIKIKKADIEKREKELNNGLPIISKRLKIKNPPIIELMEPKIIRSKKDITISIPKIPRVDKNKKVPIIVANKPEVFQQKEGEKKEKLNLTVNHDIEKFTIKGAGAEIEKEPKYFKNLPGLNKDHPKDRPMVIFFKDTEDSFIGFLEELCLREYREIKGGYAESIKISIREDLKREIERYMEAEGKIFTVNFDKNFDYSTINWKDVRNKIEQLFGQDLGYIIFKNVEFSEDFYPTQHNIQTFFKSPNPNLKNNLNRTKGICSLIWGNISYEDNDFREKYLYDVSKFDYIWGIARNKYLQTISNIGEPYLTITHRNKGKQESDIHYCLKLFVVKLISKKLGLERVVDIIKTIKTEQKSLDNYVPDIYVQGSEDEYAGEVFEIETLFGEGINALKKIDETIERYTKEGLYNINQLNIVLENFTIIRHLEDLLAKYKIYKVLKREGFINFDLEIWGLDVSENELITLKKISKIVCELKDNGFMPLLK